MILCYVKSGTTFKPGSLVGSLCDGADYVSLPNGDAVGVLHGGAAMARKTLRAQSGVTVFPPLHKVPNAAHIALVAYAGAVATDTTSDILEKLHDYHKQPRFHPDATARTNDAAQDLWPPTTDSSTATTTTTTQTPAPTSGTGDAVATSSG